MGTQGAVQVTPGNGKRNCEGAGIATTPGRRGAQGELVGASTSHASAAAPARPAPRARSRPRHVLPCSGRAGAAQPGGARRGRVGPCPLPRGRRRHRRGGAEASGAHGDAGPGPALPPRMRTAPRASPTARGGGGAG